MRVVVGRARGGVRRRIGGAQRPVVLVLVSLVALLGIPVATAGPAAAAPCPTFGPSDRWISGYTIDGQTGSYFADGFLQDDLGMDDAGHNLFGQITSINGQTPYPNSIQAFRLCSLVGGVDADVYGPNTGLQFGATLSADGNELVDGSWGTPSFGNVTGTFSSARVIRSAQNVGTTLTTDTGATGATPVEPLQVAVTSPTVGTLSAALGTSANPALDGYQLLNQLVHVEAPAATVLAPLEIQFVLDSSVLLGAPAGEVQVFRNGALVANCTPGTSAIPNPCVASRVALPGGDVQLTVRTAAASIWSFGVKPSRAPLRVWSSVLPGAQVGHAFSARLTGLGGTAPYKWKKLAKLPKGLKLKAKTGVISGTPKVAGKFTVGVRVRDKAKHTATKTITFQIT